MKIIVFKQTFQTLYKKLFFISQEWTVGQCILLPCLYTGDHSYNCASDFNYRV